MDRAQAQGGARAGRKPEHAHVIRMVPKRRDELLDGGSLYWVIKGNVRVRQRLLDIRVFTDGEGIQRCRLVLDRALVADRMAAEAAVPGLALLRAEGRPAGPQGRRRRICRRRSGPNSPRSG